MTRGGSENVRREDVAMGMAELLRHDCSISDNKLRTFLSFGAEAVPHLEAILEQGLERAGGSRPLPHKNREWFQAIHALYLLAHLSATSSLDLVLRFLAQKPADLDYWLHDLLDDDLWEVIFLLGQERLDELEAFLAAPDNNSFSRLAVGTALVQIALHFPEKRQPVAAVFRRFLSFEKNDPELLGLVAGELMDLLEPSLQAPILAALEQHEVWPGFLSAEEVDFCYSRGHKRMRTPADIYHRYAAFRRHASFSRTVLPEENAEEQPRMQKSKV